MIHSVTGVWPQFFRPPFGDYGPATGPSANGQTNTQNTTTLLNTVTSDLTAKYRSAGRLLNGAHRLVGGLHRFGESSAYAGRDRRCSNDCAERGASS